jgi:hypothetical protein
MMTSLDFPVPAYMLRPCVVPRWDQGLSLVTFCPNSFAFSFFDPSIDRFIKGYDGKKRKKKRRSKKEKKGKGRKECGEEEAYREET